MHSESLAIRTLWAAVLFAALTAVVLNFVLMPIESSGRLPALTDHLTFWVPNARADQQSDTVAQQAASLWSPAGDSSTVGELAGGPSSAVARFLTRTRTPGSRGRNLLVLTSSTLAELPSRAAHGSRRDADPRALLARTPVIAQLASEPLQLAVSSHSGIRSTAQLLARARESPSRKLFGVANDAWLQDNLAELVVRARLPGRLPYEVFATSAAAIDGLDDGSAAVVLAPRSALRSALRDRQVRILPWPGTPPTAWIAVAAPPGASATDVLRLRRRARRVVVGSGWKALLEHEGLRPVTLSPAGLRHFLRDRSRTAARLQALASRVIEG